MTTQPTLTIRYRDGERVRPWGSGPYEFGARTETGLVLITANRAIQANLHGVCGWFDCQGGWLIHRRANTGQISMVVHSGGRTVDLDAGHVVLQRGPGHVLINLRGDRGARETLRIDWHIEETLREPPPARRSGAVATVVARPSSEDRRGRLLSDLEAAVLTIAAAHRGPGVQTHADIAALVPGATDRQVRKAIERATGKARLEGYDQQPRPGVSAAQLVAAWMIDNGYLEAPLR